MPSTEEQQAIDRGDVLPEETTVTEEVVEEVVTDPEVLKAVGDSEGEQEQEEEEHAVSMRRGWARSAEGGAGAGVVHPAYRSSSTGRPASQRWSRPPARTGDPGRATVIGPGPPGFFAG